MIRYFTLVSVLYFIVGCTSPQKEQRKTYVDSNEVVNDTFYIRHEVRNDTLVEAVFIDSNKTSRFYDDILRFDETDTANIRHYTDLIHQRNIKLTEFDTYGLASVWVPVYQYQSKYYLYNPSDWGNRATKYITPSLLMLYSFDGYTPIAISAFSRISDNVFNIKLKHIAEDESLPDEVNIYIIDPKTKLAVWEYKRGLYSEYDLAVPAAYLRQYPIVVIESDMGKRVEYDFAAVNFKKLIAGAKK